MPLILEIDYLLGVAFATRSPESVEPDWPPQPDRVFSALVATWAIHGKPGDERLALEWLEQQPAPEIMASGHYVRPASSFYVPPNDYEIGEGALHSRWYLEFLLRGLRPPETGGLAKAWHKALSVHPRYRERKERRFQAALPHNPVVRLIWDSDESTHLEQLRSLARDLSYIGHSTSLTRCTFKIDLIADDSARQKAQRSVYRGRLSELEAGYNAGRRPSDGPPMKLPKWASTQQANSFSSSWLTFEIVDGALDLRAAPIACKALMKALMSGYEATSGADAIPSWVSGHEADRSPTKGPHLAAVPLAFLGYEHSDGALMGLAIVPPRDRGDLLADPGFRKALLNITRTLEDGRRAARLTFGREGALDVALTLETDRASLDPRRYCTDRRTWATATPMVLDRHLKARSGEDIQAEMERLVADACQRSVGVRPVKVVVDKHSAIRGAPSSYPSGKAPSWTGWRVPETFASRRLAHAVIDFGGPISGPLLIGAARHCGLGLCLPVDAGAA